MPADYCGDCCAADFCPFCFIVQDANELTKLKELAASGGGQTQVVVVQP
jgi:hypothetical protein